MKYARGLWSRLPVLFVLFSFFLLFIQTESLFCQKLPHSLISVPNPKGLYGNGYVSDPDSILSPEQIQVLNNLVARIEDSTTAQIAVVLVYSIGQENPKMFATDLFKKWGIGQAGKDNGLLVFTVMDQRRTEFETGYGLEGVLPDAICYRIGMQELVPHFKDGDYFTGLQQALLGIQQVLLNPEVRDEIYAKDPVSTGDRRNSGDGPLTWYLRITFVAMILLLSNLWSVWRSKEDLYDKYQRIHKLHGFWWAILFPVPYLLIYWGVRRLLKKLRTTPRYSKETGKKMVLLSEQEEDEWLEAGQVSEETVGSVDYDVWMTEDRTEKLILSYHKRFSKYSKCPSCGFKTWHLVKTEVLEAATYHAQGEGLRVHECQNCHHRKEEVYVIPMKTKSSGGGRGSGGGGGSWGGGSSGGGGGGVSW